MHQMRGAARHAAGSNDYLSKVARNWELFISNKPVDRADVRPVVLDSWTRCKNQGVDPFRPQVTKSAVIDQLNHARVRNELFLEALLACVPQISDQLDKQRCAIAAADAQGTLLTIHGNRGYVTDLCQNWSAPGFQWDEKRNGTNAIGTSLALGGGVKVHAHEHFCQPDKRLTCIADLVRDPFDRAILGVIDITSDDPDADVEMQALLQRVILEVSGGIEASVSSELARIRDAYSDARRHGEGLIAFDRYGRVVACQGAERLAPELAAGKPLDGFDAEVVRSRSVTALAGWLRSADVRWFGDGSGGLLHFERAPRIRSLRGDVQLAPSLAAVAAASPSLTPLLQRAQLFALRKMPVLLLGDTGSGKDVIARGIHEAWAKPGAPFVAVNCAALPKDLAASELFGHVDGAFTGSRRGGAAGRFEDADGGTIFLDEIGDMPLDLQPYLLRVLEQRVVSRLGESRERPVDVQVVAATNCTLANEIDGGRFRSDLFFRLNCGLIDVPSLRHRIADLEPLVDALLARILNPGEAMPAFGPGLLDALRQYEWPGNVRELRNVLECLIAMSPDGTLDIADLPDSFGNGLPSSLKSGMPDGRLNLIERDTIVTTLERRNGDVAAAAVELGISRATIYRRLSKYGIRRAEMPASPRELQ